MKRGIGFLAIAVVVAVVTLIFVASNLPGKSPFTRPTPSVFPSAFPSILPTPTPLAQQVDLKSFDSWKDVSDFLKSARAGSYGGYYGRGSAEILTAVPQAATAQKSGDTSGAGAADYSTTNIQVAGVDEADILKNDGTFLYSVSDGRIAILQAYPAPQAKLLSFMNDSYYSSIFVKADRLVAFGTEPFNWTPILPPELREQETQAVEGGGAVGSRGQIPVGAPISILPYPRPYFEESAFIKVFDVSDRASPKLLKKIDFKGSYVQSRLIDGRVYAVFSQYASPIVRPLYAVDGQLREFSPTEVSYFDYPDQSYQFTTVVGFDVDDLAKPEARKVVLMGGTNTLFVSKESLYISFTRHDYYRPYYGFNNWIVWKQVVVPLMPSEYLEKLAAIDESDASEWRKDNLRLQVAREYVDSLGEEKRNEVYLQINAKQEEARNQSESESKRVPGEATVIHKFSLGEQISYAGKGEVPGHALNQFSMDEHAGHFRIATTIGEVWGGRVRCLAIGCVQPSPTPSTNNVYVLDATSLKIVGRLEGLAPGEKIYSARFMGDKAYLVTFKKVDPLFVIDLSQPTEPKLLGKLKIPGYSDYLHPYGENHLIGLGKEAEPDEQGDFAWYQGVKLSLFDVSDLANPREVASYKIGDRGTDSNALHDHKAFLFSAERGLLVIPVTLAEINPEQYPQGVEPKSYGEFTFQGAYVFNVSLEGFGLRGRISHATQEDLDKSGEYYWGGGTDVQRSAYINDVLYTVSTRFVKANDLQSLEERASVELPRAEAPQPYYLK